MPKSDKEVQEDPYLLLGFGVNSYFDVMLDLMKILCFCFNILYFYYFPDPFICNIFIE